VRIVEENSRALNFKSYGFEAERGRRSGVGETVFQKHPCNICRMPTR